MDHPFGTVTRHHDPSLHFNFQEKSTCGWYDALHNTAYVWFCILYCFTDVNQDDSPKSLRLNLRTPKCFNCNLQRTTSHWSYCNGWLGSTHPTQDVSLQVLGSLNPNLNLSWKLNPINDLDWHPREYLFISAFPEVFVGGWPGLLSDVPATFQWVLRATASNLEMGMAEWPRFGWYDLSFKQTWRRFDVFLSFFPRNLWTLNIYLFCHNTKDIW